MEDDAAFMQEALREAKEAESRAEVPVGAVLVLENQIIGRGHNQTILRNDPSAHAEILALRAAGQKLQNYRLPETTLYVTLEPCAMCFSALVQARVKRVVFGATTKLDFFNHQFETTGGVMAAECSQILQVFFKQRRVK